jgi:hypothetical protein
MIGLIRGLAVCDLREINQYAASMPPNCRQANADGAAKAPPPQLPRSIFLLMT